MGENDKLIEDLRETNETLKRDLEKYKSLYINYPLSYQSLDEEGSIIEVNPTWLRTLGYKAEEVIGKNFSEFLHPEAKPHFSKRLQNLIQDGSIRGIEYKMIHRKGHYVDVFFNSCVGYEKNGSFRQTYCVFQDITQSKMAEEALRESEERFRLIANNVLDVIWVFNFTLDRFQYISPSVFQLRGYTVEEAMKQNLNESMTPGSAKRIAELTSRRLREFRNHPDVQKIYYDEIQQPCKNGGIVWVETSTRYSFNRNDEIEVFGISRDITKRKRAEDALKESEAKNRAILNAIPDLMFIQDRKGTFLDYHVSNGADLYIPPENFLGKRAQEVFPAEFATKINSLIEKVIQKGDIQIFEYPLSFKNEHRFFEARIVPYDEHKVLSIIREITDRKKVEAELEKHHEHLEDIVRERTQQIEEKNRELERFNKLFVGREFRIKELREKVKQLEKELQEKNS